MSNGENRVVRQEFLKTNRARLNYSIHWQMKMEVYVIKCTPERKLVDMIDTVKILRIRLS